MAVVCRHWPTRFGKCGSLLVSFQHWNTCWVLWQGHHFHSWNFRGCGQRSWHCGKMKNHKIIFLPCLLVVRENLCSQKFLWNTCWVLWQGCHFHSWNCRGCGQRSWHCGEIKNHKMIFLLCLLVVCKNLCLQKFPAIQYKTPHLLDLLHVTIKSTH